MQCLCGETAKKTYLKQRTVRRADEREVTFTDVPAEVCPACGETYFTPEVSGMMLRLGDVSRVDPVPFPSARPLSPKRIFEIRQRLALTQARLGDLLGLSPTSVALWEQGRRKPDGPSRVLLRLMDVLGPFAGAVPGRGRRGGVHIRKAAAR